MHIAICVPTFKRPAGLRALMLGLNNLVCAEGVEFRAVIVDNDARGSARSVLNEISRELNYPVEYVLEPKRGLSSVRNTALDNAMDADAVVFIDDDEVPDPRWLNELVMAQQVYGADVVRGVVVPRFAQAVPDWIAKGGFFERPRPATGTVLQEAATSNVLIGTRVLRTTGLRFDPQFSLSGSEDTDFFGELAAAGALIIAANNAIVYETVPAERASARWLSLRALRISNADAFLSLKRSSSLATRTRIFLHGISRLAVGVALAVFTIPFGRVAMVDNLRRIARAAGNLMAAIGLRYNEYG
jgi:glycosyltransferase involved in cell wall biosynthesis